MNAALSWTLITHLIMVIGGAVIMYGGARAVYTLLNAQSNISLTKSVFTMLAGVLPVGLSLYMRSTHLAPITYSWALPVFIIFVILGGAMFSLIVIDAWERVMRTSKADSKNCSHETRQNAGCTRYRSCPPDE